METKEKKKHLTGKMRNLIEYMKNMVDLNPNILLSTLNANKLNTPTERKGGKKQLHSAYKRHD